MAKHSALVALLETEVEPTQKDYNDIVEDVIKNPQLISGLSEETVRDDFLILLTIRHHRLAKVFHRVHSVLQQNAKSMAASQIASGLAELLVDILPYLDQLLETTQVLDFVVPALDICFLPSQRLALRELASLLAKSGTLLEHLVSDHRGAEIIRQWILMQSSTALDMETLELWTDRLVSMVQNCAIDHEVADNIQQWHLLKNLKESLRKVDRGNPIASGKRPALVTRHDLPALASMTQLNKDDKKSRLTGNQDTNNAIPSLQDSDKRSLKAFSIHVPGSKNSLREVIKRLEGQETTKILLAITSKLPCYLCTSSLGDSSQSSNGETRNESFQAVPTPPIETLDKGIGLWKVLLSPQALKSVLHLGSQRIDGSITDKLTEIASGCWERDQPVAPSKTQKKRLKVPIKITKCGQNHFILWQIAIGVDEAMEVPQQQIKVWEVCDYAEIPKIVDRIVFLQQSYSAETVGRCHRRSSAVDEIQFPIRFEDFSSQPIKSARPPTDLDIRSVDQNIIEMTNKFYSLTEPVIRSILSNNLSAEFPFDLSKDEARVFRHFRTASLILGRSGTGKTTCLIFKLVGKYLASRAVPDERPVRQVLVTRSTFLADKLSSYTQRLIETLLLKSADPDSSQPSEHKVSSTAKEDLEQYTALTLRDKSFPLVCTWDNFLGILENTARKYDSRRSHYSGEPADERSSEFTNKRPSMNGHVVDFHAFKSNYWPHISHALTKGLPVNLIFAEIMGVIKGSASSRTSLEPLRREEYLTRSCRLAPTFILEEERSRVYEVFQMYEKLKLELGGVDYVDRVVKLIRAVRQDSSLNQLLRFTFDEVYIDEIQDQRCLDIELLLSFVKDGRGFHFAGDTAQAISQESTFRFADIKALFYEHFAAASDATHQAELAHPHMFTLCENYRSHEGILALASLVMGMIWKGFPETVDKLDPEIGHLDGPRPVVFCGVQLDTLCSKNVGHNEFSAGTTDFGAEQVILVRDTHMKSNLRDQIGDFALILTILESKGMEFDDVILWNFFTECPDQPGIRSLETLQKEPSMFDPKRHGSMCSELKNLYVAITRARVHLYIMESSKTTAATILKFLGDNTPKSIVDVTSPSHEDFAMRLEMLRPATSLDPKQWSRRGAELLQLGMFIEAVRCFRNGKDENSETTAEGHRLECAAKACSDDTEAAQHLTLALKCFKKVKLIDEAARVLVALGKSEDAAEILLQNKRYFKAAQLFAKADLSMRAVECYHLAKDYSEAAAILNKKEDYDGLVLYLHKNRDKIPTKIPQSYRSLCKLLLKQQKVSVESRKYAIELLGSIAEQEKCFLDYGMDEELQGLYASQSRNIDLLHLYSKNGRLEQALSLAITKDLLQKPEESLETEVLNLLDFVWAGHMQRSRQQPSPASFKLPPGVLTPKVKIRAEQWEACSLACNREGSIARQSIACISVSVPKTLCCLRSILNTTTITDAKHLNDLPYEMMREAIDFTRDLVLNKNGNALNILLLLACLWKPANGNGHLMVLPWSPLRNVLADISSSDYTKFVKQRVLDDLASAILTLDTKARGLWKEKWPKGCVHFITLGFCPRQRNGEPCNWLHQAISEQDCSQIAEDLLLMNGIFCDLAAVYYRRAMNETFQDKYLGIKRHWLERLLRELTYLSAVEQDASTIKTTQAKLSNEKKYISIFSFLEELLYFRIGREWSTRSDFSSLVEQMQLAKKFGLNLQNRLFRAVSHRLFHDKRDLMQRHLVLLNRFEHDLSSQNALAFQRNLNIFLRNLENIEVQALSTLHALTAVFEYLAVYMILKTCDISCVLTQSYLNRCVPLFADAMRAIEPSSRFDSNEEYRKCLMELSKAFCRILSRFNQAPQPGVTLLCSGKTHHPLLLRQRCADLVAIVVANLVPQRPTGLAELWTIANETFGYDFVRAHHFRGPTPYDITAKLEPSFLRYSGKDCLVVVIKHHIKDTRFPRLEHQPGVKSVSFDHICPPTPTSATTPALTDNPPSTSTDSSQQEYTTAELEAITKIQRLWRSCHRKVKDRRSYMQLPEARAVARFIALGAKCPATLSFVDRVALRGLLIAQGVAASLKLADVRGTLSKLQEDAMSCAEYVDISTQLFESVDEVLGRIRDVDALLGKAEEKMSEGYLEGLIKEGRASDLEKALNEVESVIANIEQSMLETRKMISTVSGGSG